MLQKLDDKKFEAILSEVHKEMEKHTTQVSHDKQLWRNLLLRYLMINSCDL
jgi:hypothetical protein